MIVIFSRFMHTYIHIQRFFYKMNRSAGSPSMTTHEVAKAPCFRVKYNLKTRIFHNGMTLLK